MNNTLRYGFMVLELLAKSGSDCSTSELARQMGLSKSQVSRVLKTLSEIGYITQNPNNRQYSINLSVLKLAHNYLGNMKSRHVIRPYMQELVDKFDKECYSSVPVGIEAIVCDVIYSRNHSSVSSDAIMAQVGAVNSPYKTASGKVCAAFLSSTQLEELMDRVPLEDQKDIGDMTRDSILKEYDNIRKFKVARRNPDIEDGENAIAAPIFDRDGNLIATIGMAMPWGKLSKEVWDEYQNAIVRAANGASFALGYPLR